MVWKALRNRLEKIYPVPLEVTESGKPLHHAVLISKDRARGVVFLWGDNNPQGLEFLSKKDIATSPEILVPKLQKRLELHDQVIKRMNYTGETYRQAEKMLRHQKEAL